MRILICDDDAGVRENIRNRIEDYFRRKPLYLPCELEEFSDGRELLSDSGKKDIVFLDIEMPGVNGLIAGRELRKNNRDVIILIVSAYSQYLDETMDFQVFRYLTKPLEKRRFEKSLENAVAFYLERNVPVMVETGKTTACVESRSIIMVEARDKKTYVHTLKEEYETLKPLQYWAEILPEGIFVQTHRSFLVNLNYVKKFDHETIYMEDGESSAFLTKRKYSAFKKEYQRYLALQR